MDTQEEEPAAAAAAAAAAPTSRDPDVVNHLDTKEDQEAALLLLDNMLLTDRYNEFVAPDTGARVDLKSSTQLLTEYCQQLSRDSYYCPRPIFWMVTIPKKNDKDSGRSSSSSSSSCSNSSSNSSSSASSSSSIVTSSDRNGNGNGKQEYLFR